MLLLVTKEDIEEAIRMIIILNKMQNPAQNAVVVTPGEARDLFRRFFDAVTLPLWRFSWFFHPNPLQFSGFYAILYPYPADSGTL